MAYSTIELEVVDGIASLTLQRPPVNILNIHMMEEISEALEATMAAPDVYVLIIKAEGKAFSAGVAVEDHIGEWTEPMIDTFHKLFHVLDRIECPTIGVIEGAALGGGCELAAFCDITVAAEHAKFSQPEINLGLFPPVAAAYFPWVMGYNKIMELLLTGKTIQAAEAKEIGLINTVLPSEETEAYVQNFVTHLSKKSPVALKATKKAVRSAMPSSMAAAISEAEQLYLRELMKTNDAQEGLQAFMDKRNPAWTNS